MLTKGEVKRFLRARSWRFVLDGRPAAAGRPVAPYHWHGRPVYYRPGTSDLGLIYNILLKTGRKGEYWVPQALDPRVILDIGGNVGIASCYFAARFPNARIYSFEPVPANVELLRRNVAPYPNVNVVPFGLGRSSGAMQIMSSDDDRNLGGFSFYRQGSNADTTTEVQVQEVNAALHHLGIDKFDMIKIDTEGAEHEILTTLDPAKLRSTKWIMGELHGERDFELLAYLSQWFDIETKKSLKNRLFMFHACNRSLTRQLLLK